jgi:hypothetical protein
VVATTPLVVLVSKILLVDEALVRVLVVLDASRSAVEICCTSPFAPITKREEVAVPLATEVRVVVPRVAVEVAVIFPEVRLVPVALSKIRLEM